MKTKPSEFFWLAVLVVIVVGTLVLVGLIVGPRLREILPTRTAKTQVPGISSDEGSARVEAVLQPFIAEEIERVTKGDMDVLHVEEQGDFAVTLVIWVKETPTEAQGREMDALLASEHAVTRLVNVSRVPQLDYMVFVIVSAFDCMADGTSENPLRCVPDQAVMGGYVVPDSGLDLLNLEE